MPISDTPRPSSGSDTGGRGSGGGGGGSSFNKFNIDMLEEHNKVRRKHGTPDLVLDDGLIASA